MNQQKTYKVLILNGPGVAEPDALNDLDYDGISLSDIERTCLECGEQQSLTVSFFHANDPEEVIESLKSNAASYDALVINPIGYTKALNADYEAYRNTTQSLANTNKPIVEVHLTNIFKLEAEVAKPLRNPEGQMAFVCGLGLSSYSIALRAIRNRLDVLSSQEGSI